MGHGSSALRHLSADGQHRAALAEPAPRQANEIPRATERESARALATIEQLALIFGEGHDLMHSATRLRANMGLGQRALAALNRLNMANVESAFRENHPRAQEMLHFLDQVRDRTAAFKLRNMDIFFDPASERAVVTEARFVHSLYMRLSQELPDAHVGAMCGEFARCCFDALLSEQTETDFELMKLTEQNFLVRDRVRRPDHAFIVIGRNGDTDPADPESWNEDAVICDASQGQVYPKDQMRARFAEIVRFTLGSTRCEIVVRAEGGVSPLARERAV